jgi:hypothetical protein
MSPRVSISLIATAMALVGCATQENGPFAAPLPALPKDAVGVQSWLEDQRIRCWDPGLRSGSQSVVPADTRIRPTYISKCSTEFPVAMLRRDVQAACHVVFDIDDNGIPVAPATTCHVVGASFTEAAIMNDMYLALAQRVATQQRFVSRAQEREGATRSRLLQRVRFVLAQSVNGLPAYPPRALDATSDQPNPLLLE